MYTIKAYDGLDNRFLVQSLALGAIGYCAIWVCYSRLLHPLAKYPGPFWASVSRVWTVLHVFRGDAEKVQRKLHERYGPIVRIAPNELAVSDPQAIKRIYGVNSGFIKTDFYLAYRPPFARFPDHFSAIDEKEHAERRRIVNHVYTMTSILQSEDYIEKCVDVWLKKLGEMADRKESFELFKWTRMYAYDVIGELYFSKMFGFLEAGDDALGYMAATDVLIPVQTLAGIMPTYIRSLYMLMGIFFPQIRNALNALASLTAATDKSLKDRLDQLNSQSEKQPQRADILGKILDIHHKNGARLNFELDDVKMEAFAAFFAGSETTALTLSGIVYHIIRNSQVYDRLTEEIDQATKNGQLSSPHIAYKEAYSLPYLVACVKEGIRMHPITGLTFPRLAPKGGCEVAGQWIPDRARVGINPCVVHYDKSVFGDDADQFNPSRWLKPDAQAMDRYIMQFGAGARTCLGKHISMCEIYKSIPLIMRNYKLELETQDEMETTSWWFHKPVAINLRVERR